MVLLSQVSSRKRKKRSMGATDVNCDIVLVVRAIRSFCIVVVNL